MRIVVTGAAGYLGGLVVEAALARGATTEVVGVDRAGSARQHARYRHVALDLATAPDDTLAEAFAGADGVVHAAFAVLKGPTSERDNAEAQRRALSASRAIPDWWVLSGAAVYGFRDDRDALGGRLGEDAPWGAALGVPYAEAKQALEGLARAEAAAAGARLRLLRPSNVAGPGSAIERAGFLTGPAIVAPRTAHPLRQQLLHEADFVSAWGWLWEVPAGAYNVAPDDWLTLEAAAAALGKPYRELPGWALTPMADLAFRLGQSPYDASWLTFLTRPPIVLANDTLRARGWAPRHTTEEALLALAARF